MKKFWMWLGRLAGKHLGYPSVSIDEILKETEKGLDDKQKAIQKRGQFYKSYNSFSGMDIKVYFEYDDGTVECIPEIQAISWDIKFLLGPSVSHPIEGSIVAILFDEDSIALRKNKIQNIVLRAANEYGQCAVARLESVRFKRLQYGISIDDIVSECNWTYTAERFEHWAPPTRCYHLVDGKWAVVDYCKKCQLDELERKES
jgi:hypothetical protein